MKSNLVCDFWLQLRPDFESIKDFIHFNHHTSIKIFGSFCFPPTAKFSQKFNENIIGLEKNIKGLETKPEKYFNFKYILKVTV